MRRSLRIMFLIIGTALLQGCCNPTYVPLKVALKAVGKDLVETKVTNISDLLGTDQEAKASLKEQIEDFQCLHGKANPLIPVFAKDFSLSLQGAITLGGNVTGGATGPVPTGSIGFNVSDAKTQGLTVPITWTPLESLPKAYLQQQMGYLTDRETISFKTNYAEIAQDTYMKLTEQIKLLIDGWPKTKTTKEGCSSRKEGEYPGGTIPKLMTK